MARGVAHSDETKAAVLAALLAGQSLNSVAEQYGLSKATIIAWRERSNLSGESVEPQKRKELSEEIFDLINANLRTLNAQVRFFGDTEWLRQQNAADVAVLHGVIADKTFRLLGALRPEESTDGIEEATAGV